jgi:hypothetical protein
MGRMKDEYNSPCPGLGTKVKGHRHSNRCKPLVTIAEYKTFDANALAEVVATFVWQSLPLTSHDTLTGHMANDDPSPSAPAAIDDDDIEPGEQLRLALESPNAPARLSRCQIAPLCRPKRRPISACEIPCRYNATTRSRSAALRRGSRIGTSRRNTDSTELSARPDSSAGWLAVTPAL